MTFIDLPSLACGRYEGGEPPYPLIAGTCATTAGPIDYDTSEQDI